MMTKPTSDNNDSISCKNNNNNDKSNSSRSNFLKNKSPAPAASSRNKDVYSGSGGHDVDVDKSQQEQRGQQQQQLIAQDYVAGPSDNTLDQLSVPVSIPNNDNAQSFREQQAIVTNTSLSLSAGYDERTPLLLRGSSERLNNNDRLDSSYQQEEQENDDDDDDGNAKRASDGKTQIDKPVTWLTLPHRRQLLILALCRFSEPISSTSLLSYLYYYIKSLPGSTSTEIISQRAGILVATFAFLQFITSILWGRLSDVYGRKPVIMMGLLVSTIGITGMGFSSSFEMAVVCRGLSGIGNGTVGVLRTMVAETVREKRYLSRAFLILPMCFNIGIVVGPTLGGLLAKPVETYPGLFGEGGILEGTFVAGLFTRFQYALPNLVSAVFLFCSFLTATFLLQETLSVERSIVPKWLRSSWSKICGIYQQRQYKLYTAIPNGGDEEEREEEDNVHLQATDTLKSKSKQPLTFRECFTPSIVMVLIAFVIIPLHNATFMQLFPLFLSSPRAVSDNNHSLIFFSGGLALPPSAVGLSMSIIGVVGITLQLLFFARLQARLGFLRCYQIFIVLFPVSYILAPYLAIIPSSTPPPGPASGIWLWLGVVVISFIQVTGRVFALTANTVLLQNAVEDRRALGTVNGVGTSLSALSRTVGPLTAGWAYGLSLRKGIVGAVWWGLAVVAVVGVVQSKWVKEGKGFAEIEQEQEYEERVARGEIVDSRSR